ncbi:MAG: homoserine kinase [Brockia lithotrophica]|nr:homoserine kinase [Brockia lithotrophica]
MEAEATHEMFATNGGPEAPAVVVRVPATSANLGSGFDAVGWAVDRYLYAEVRPARETEARGGPPSRFEVVGEVPSDARAEGASLFFRAVEEAFARAGRAAPDLAVRLQSEIPLGKGLGSSAAVIVAGLVAANVLLEGKLSVGELLSLATRLEGHPDNVAPALLGGLVVARAEGEEVSAVRLRLPRAPALLAFVPDVELRTSASRRLLPDAYARETAVAAAGRAALLVAALAAGELEKLPAAFGDGLHEPYRLPHIPGAEELYALCASARPHGCLGCYLSGAGPTIMAVFATQGAREDFRRRFSEHPLAHAFVPEPLSLVEEGAVVLARTPRGFSR